jgi:UDP-N-acetylglucosamine acyltransferase
VAQDVPPFITVDGNPLAVRAVNLVGLKRRDFSAERQAAVRQMHKLLYRSGLPLADATAQIAALADGAADGVAGDVQTMLQFLAGATRGIVR